MGLPILTSSVGFFRKNEIKRFLACAVGRHATTIRTKKGVALASADGVGVDMEGAAAMLTSTFNPARFFFVNITGDFIGVQAVRCSQSVPFGFTFLRAKRTVEARERWPIQINAALFAFIRAHVFTHHSADLLKVRYSMQLKVRYKTGKVKQLKRTFYGHARSAVTYLYLIARSVTNRGRAGAQGRLGGGQDFNFDMSGAAQARFKIDVLTVARPIQRFAKVIRLARFWQDE